MIAVGVTYHSVVADFEDDEGHQHGEGNEALVEQRLDLFRRVPAPRTHRGQKPATRVQNLRTGAHAVLKSGAGRNRRETDG